MTAPTTGFNIAIWDNTANGSSEIISVYGSVRKGRKAWLRQDKSLRGVYGHADTHVSHSVRVGRLSYVLSGIVNGHRKYMEPMVLV